jgi:UDP-N-acetylglucosamine transferase subunit ALG13
LEALFPNQIDCIGFPYVSNQLLYQDYPLMIFVTVGTDQPFDRMVRVIDSWAAERERTDIFAQIGDGGWEPQAFPYANYLSPPEFMERFREARVIVAHAGMGTILSALHHGKPILVMPKKASLGEQRNEHQLATARRLNQMGKIHVAFDEAELRVKLDHLDEMIAKDSIAPFASPGLINGLREFIDQEGRN